MKDLLDHATITMDRGKARMAFLEYRQAVRERHSVEDEQIMRGYRAMSLGKQLINLRQVIQAGGEFENGLPRLAVAQADLSWAYCERHLSGAVRFLPGSLRDVSPLRRKGVFNFPGPTLKPWTGAVPWQEWSGRHVRAMVPIVPPGLRPAAALSNYATLFEVDKWEKAPRPPGDPALLKYLGGELYAVVAVWDLSQLEQSVLAARTLA